MNVEKVRGLLRNKRIGLEVTIHAAVQALKDGLVTEDLEFALFQGKKIEDYGNRVYYSLLHLRMTYRFIL